MNIIKLPFVHFGTQAKPRPVEAPASVKTRSARFILKEDDPIVLSVRATEEYERYQRETPWHVKVKRFALTKLLSNFVIAKMPEGVYGGPIDLKVPKRIRDRSEWAEKILNANNITVPDRKQVQNWHYARRHNPDIISPD